MSFRCRDPFLLHDVSVGLTAGRVRLAGFSAIGSLVPRAVAALASRHPGLQISLTDTHPPDAIELLRSGRIEVAIIFRYDETEAEPVGVRLHYLLDDPLAARRGRTRASPRPPRGRRRLSHPGDAPLPHS